MKLVRLILVGLSLGVFSGASAEEVKKVGDNVTVVEKHVGPSNHEPLDSLLFALGTMRLIFSTIPEIDRDVLLANSGTMVDFSPDTVCVLPWANAQVACRFFPAAARDMPPLPRPDPRQTKVAGEP